jgi:hypothetical protein
VPFVTEAGGVTGPVGLGLGENIPENQDVESGVEEAEAEAEADAGGVEVGEAA